MISVDPTRPTDTNLENARKFNEHRRRLRSSVTGSIHDDSNDINDCSSKDTPATNPNTKIYSPSSIHTNDNNKIDNKIDNNNDNTKDHRFDSNGFISGYERKRQSVSSNQSDSDDSDDDMMAYFANQPTPAFLQGRLQESRSSSSNNSNVQKGDLKLDMRPKTTANGSIKTTASVEPQSNSDSITNNINAKDINIEAMVQRQEEWLMNRKQKINKMKMEIENKKKQELEVVPDLKVGQLSWERAKREHAMQAEKMMRIDNMKRVQQILKQERKIINKIDELNSQNISVPEKRRKKKKKKALRQRDDDDYSMAIDMGGLGLGGARPSYMDDNDYDNFDYSNNGYVQKPKKEKAVVSDKHVRRAGLQMEADSLDLLFDDINTNSYTKTKRSPNKKSLSSRNANYDTCLTARNPSTSSSIVTGQPYNRPKSADMTRRAKVDWDDNPNPHSLHRNRVKATSNTSNEDKEWLANIMKERQLQRTKSSPNFLSNSDEDAHLEAAMAKRRADEEARLFGASSTSNNEVPAYEYDDLYISDDSSDNDDNGDKKETNIYGHSNNNNSNDSKVSDHHYHDDDDDDDIFDLTPNPTPRHLTPRTIITPRNSMNTIIGSSYLSTSSVTKLQTTSEIEASILETKPVPTESSSSSSSSSSSEGYNPFSKQPSASVISNPYRPECSIKQPSAILGSNPYRQELNQNPSYTTNQTAAPITTTSGSSNNTTSNIAKFSSGTYDVLGAFFDPSSTTDKGRFRVGDARDFDTDSMYRKVDVLNEHVTLLLGKLRSTGENKVITILFDRAEFTETQAHAWWICNRNRLPI